MSESSVPSLAPLSAFNDRQLSFFQQCTDLIAAATAGGHANVAPLKTLLEVAVHQKCDRSHTESVAVLVHLLPDLGLRLQSMSSAKVKTWLLGFLEALLRWHADPFVPSALNIVTSMTAEENIAVVKKVLSLGCTLFPMVYSWLAAHSASWGVVHESMLRAVEQLKEQLISLWKGPNEGIKPAVIKFMEIVILTLSNDKPNPTQQRASTGDKREELRPFTLRELSAGHSVLTQDALKAEVQSVLSQLLTFAPSNATNFSSLLKTMSTLCKQRSLQLSNRIVERLNEIVELILMEEVQRQLLPSEQQVARVKKDLQTCLLDVLKSQHFALPTFDAQHATLMGRLLALGSESQAFEVEKVQSAKRVDYLKQQGESYQNQLSKETMQSQQSLTGGRPQPLSTTNLMHLLDEFSRFPREYSVELVSRAIAAFEPPPSCSVSYAAPDPSPTFLTFLETLLPEPFNDVRADTAWAQRQQFQHVAEIIKQHQDEALLTLHPPVVTEPLLPVVVRTVVPPIPVPELAPEAYDSMQRSAFTRIASQRTATSVERSGETMLRNVILAKLATTNMLHPREYTHVLDPELDVNDSEASQWTSSLLQTGPAPLRSFLAGRLQEGQTGSYESVLHILYSLLCVDTSSAVVKTVLKEKPADTVAESGEETVPDAMPFPGEFEGAEDDVHDDEDMQDTHNEEKQEVTAADSTAVTATKGSKRKRADGDSPAEDGTSTAASDADDSAALPDSKRVRSDGVTTVVPATASVLPDFARHGTIEYGDVLATLLDELREGPSAEARQQLYRRFLLDIPLLTPRVFASLDEWINDPSRSVSGLSAMRDLILYRPPVRETTLNLLLGYTHKPALTQLRSQAIRLIVNQLYTPAASSHLRPTILSYANRLLDQLGDDPDGVLADLPEIEVNVVVPPVPIYDQIELPPRKATPATPSTPAVESGEVFQPAVPPPPALTQQTSEQDRRARVEAADLKTRQEIANLIAEAERRKKLFDRLVFLRSLREKEKKLLEQQRDERMKRRVDRISRHMELYLSLCVHEPHMLRRVLQVYARCTSEFVRKCFHEQVPRIVRVLLRLHVDELITVLEEEAMSDDSASSEPLVLHCFQLMTATAAPPVALVQSVTRIYQTKQSPRFLVPVLGGLPLDAIRRFLPRLITLPLDDLRVAFHKLLHSRPPSSIKASELLVALHLILPEQRRRPAGQAVEPVQVARERKEDEDALDKRIVAAKKLCFEDAESYTPEVLGVVLSQLSDHMPLPKLLMHTVIQSMQLHASLKTFILSNILIKLISKHIHQQPVLWQGFLAASSLLLPQSINVLVQLPDHVFMQLMGMPKQEKLQTQLASFIQAYPMQVRRSIREIMQQIQQERYLQQQMAMAMQQNSAQPIVQQG